MNSFSLKNRSQKFQVSAPKHSISRNSNPSNINEYDDSFSSRPPKRGRLSGRSFKANTKYTALFNFNGYGNDELNFRKGDQVQVISQNERDRTNWWKGKSGGKEGMFPSMYVVQRNCELAPKEINPENILLQEFVGQGGFATVRRGLWRNEEVAVKINNDSSADANAKNEATFYWLLRHPNIISLLGVCNRPPDYWLVMEYARGGSLAQVLSKTLLPLKVIIDWSTQIAKAMKYLHQEAPIENIIHRDLKSKNILIFESLCDGNLENKTLKITDFGLARQALSTIKSADLAGTFEWMAPEIFKSKEISTASDVWSFGVVLWEMLTSQIPFKNFGPYQIVYGVGNNKLRLPIPRACPEYFERLLARCWNINPKERPTFEDILKDLQAMERSLSERDIEAFTVLQQEWKNEVEEEMETIRSESVNTMAPYQSFLEEVLEGIKQRFAELEKLELELIAKELALAVKQFNNAKKRKKKFNIFSWRKKHSLKISTPSNFQHNFQTIVEEKDISPKLSPNMFFQRPFTVKTIRVNTSSSQMDVQNMSTETLHHRPIMEPTNYSIAFALREIIKIAACMRIVNYDYTKPITPPPIVGFDRNSMLPSSSAPRPKHLDVVSCYPASQTIRKEDGAVPFDVDQKISPFKVKIIQMESKSKVVVTGNNPEENDYMRQSVFHGNDENQMPKSHYNGPSNYLSSTVTGAPPLQHYDSGLSFHTGITLYGSLSTLKNKAGNHGISGKISHIPSEMFPYDKVSKRQSWLNLKQGKSVSELRAFFSQKFNRDKLTVH